jgi:predicted RecA/RadA family phage recombinase
MAAGDRANFSGDVVFTAPTGGYTRGLIYNITDCYAVARETVAASADCKMALHGAVTITKNTGTGKSFAVGDKVYMDASTKKATPNATGNTLVGFAIAAASTSATTVDAWMTGLNVSAS